MYTCPLCKRQYETEKEVVKCVNKCGRDKASAGWLSSKSIYSGETTKVSYEIKTGAPSREKVNELCNELQDRGVLNSSVRELRLKTLNNWDNLNEEIKKNRINELTMMVNLYRKF